MLCRRGPETCSPRGTVCEQCGFPSGWVTVSRQAPSRHHQTLQSGLFPHHTQASFHSGFLKGLIYSPFYQCYCSFLEALVFPSNPLEAAGSNPDRVHSWATRVAEASGLQVVRDQHRCLCRLEVSGSLPPPRLHPGVPHYFSGIVFPVNSALTLESFVQLRPF